MTDLATLRRVAEALGRAEDVEGVVEATLRGCGETLGHGHVYLVLRSEDGDRLNTVGSRGYERSGIGSEVAVGQGPVGVVAATGRPLRIPNASLALRYSRIVRSQAGGSEGPEIPLPGLPAPGSQLVVPLVAGGECLGVLTVESPAFSAFDSDDEHAMLILASLVAGAIERARLTELQASPPDEPIPHGSVDGLDGRVTRRLVHHRVDDSVFVDGEYVIRGLAGRILAKLVREWLADGRTSLTNRHLRADPALELSPLRDNLESRLILLRKRLDERPCGLRLRRTGRGRFVLDADDPFTLQTIDAG